MQPERFREIRKALGLTQTELGEKLGLSLGWISKMEKGQVAIEPRTASTLMMLQWYDHIRQERRDKLKAVELFQAGTIRLHRNVDGVSSDISDEAIATNLQNIAEIEKILAEAGEPLD